jgi:hypothetical protein
MRLRGIVHVLLPRTSRTLLYGAFLSKWRFWQHGRRPEVKLTFFTNHSLDPVFWRYSCRTCCQKRHLLKLTLLARFTARVLQRPDSFTVVPIDVILQPHTQGFLLPRLDGQQKRPWLRLVCFATWLVNDFECNYSIYVGIIIILVEREWVTNL